LHVLVVVQTPITNSSGVWHVLGHASVHT
jgi:Zn-dependent M16 (insulinase) family peptidase